MRAEKNQSVSGHSLGSDARQADCAAQEVHVSPSILVAPDKFKGSLTAREAAENIAAGWRAAWPDCEIVELPIADGGDGTLEVIESTISGEWRDAMARDARGRPKKVQWLWQSEKRTAWIEAARVCGLAGLSSAELDPLTATSAGLGEVIHTSLEAGAEDICLCLGGSATNDGGCGMASALGFTFRDKHGASLDPVPCNLSLLEHIERPTQELPCKFSALVDVRNPLLGARGASRTYALQKGATPEMVETLEAALMRLTEVAARDLHAPIAETPGTGAAGGLGFGVLAFLRGRLLPGFTTIAEITGLEAAIAGADLVVTGEGRLDAQTIAGDKAPAGVARIARRLNKPVIALAGSIPLSNSLHAGFDALVPAANDSMTLEYAMTNAAALVRAAAARAALMVRQNRIL